MVPERIMSLLYRRAFTSVLLCGLIFGSLVFVRLSRGSPKPAPDFLPNVARYRSARVCSTRALVLVISHPEHGHRRQVVREAWANPRVIQPLDISVAFGVGKSGRPDLQRSLEWEAEIFGDIFQEPSFDVERVHSPTNVIQLLKTARSACDPIPTFFLKVEDGVFFNPFMLDELLRDLETFSSSNTLWCLDWQRAFDSPHSNATWWSAKSNLNTVVHPGHCVSKVYLMSARALDSIIRKHDDQNGTTMPDGDVYVTGFMARKAGTNLNLLGERFSLDSLNERDEMLFSCLAEDMEGEVWHRILEEKVNVDLKRTYDIGL